MTARDKLDTRCPFPSTLSFDPRNRSGLPPRTVDGQGFRRGDATEVTRDDMEIVSAVQLALVDKVGKERFDLWFGANTRLDLIDETLRVRVPNQFFQDWLRANFRRQIEDSCLQALGRSVPVVFHIDTQLAQPKPGAPRAVPTAILAGADTVAHAEPCVTALAVQSEMPRDADPEPSNAADGTPSTVPIHGVLNDAGSSDRKRRFASLSSFVAGEPNRVAHVAAQTAAARPGTTSPLVLHGPTSVGKTHLLEGIYTAARRQRPGLQALYLTSEQFTTNFLSALHSSGLPSFRRKYRGLDLLLIDDVQFFAGKRATLVELLHTIDTLLRDGRQLVFACDRAPVNIPELGKDLTTRLQGGLVCRIDPPDFETRRGIVQRLAGQLNLELEEPICELIASRFTSHARELAGALHRLQAQVLAQRQPITLDEAHAALDELTRNTSKAVRLVDIEQAVCRVYNLEPDSLHNSCKARDVSDPRMLAMWLARKHTRAALSEISRYFGRKSHSTVLSAQRRVETWISSNLPQRDAIRRAEEALRAG